MARTGAMHASDQLVVVLLIGRVMKTYRVIKESLRNSLQRKFSKKDRKV